MRHAVPLSTGVGLMDDTNETYYIRNYYRHGSIFVLIFYYNPLKELVRYIDVSVYLTL